jgi:hypothetical protein
MEGFMSLGLGARGAHLTEVVTLDVTPGAQLASGPTRASPSVRAKAVIFSSHGMMARSQLPSSLCISRHH